MLKFFFRLFFPFLIPSFFFWFCFAFHGRSTLEPVPSEPREHLAWNHHNDVARSIRSHITALGHASFTPQLTDLTDVSGRHILTSVCISPCMRVPSRSEIKRGIAFLRAVTFNRQGNSRTVQGIGMHTVT